MELEDTDSSGLESLQAEHERRKENSKVLMLGDGRTVNFSKTFAHSLTGLTPMRRRLAVAKACTQPWRDDGDAMPLCYLRDLEHATVQAREEHSSCCGTLFDPDYLFETEPEPISPHVLRQLAEMTPGSRRLSLALMISWCWTGRPSQELRAAALARGVELGEPEDYPDWVTRELTYSAEEYDEERNAYRPPIADTGKD